MKIRQYNLGDIYYCMTPKQVEDMQINEDYVSLTHSWTVEDNYSNIAGCGGFRYIWKGVWEAWLHSKNYDNFFHNKLLVMREIIRVMDNMFIYEHAKRIQAIVKADNFQSLKFHHVLGFEIEGRLRNYGPDGADYIMHSRIC